MFNKLKILVFFALASVLSQTALANKFLTIDDQSKVLETAVTIAAVTNIEKSTLHTAFVLTGIFNSSMTHKRHLAVLAGKVNFSGVLADDGIFAGGEINIQPQARVGGDLRLVGGSVTVAGDIHRNLTVLAGDVFVDATVAGNVELVAKSIRLGPNAKISGKISYTSNAKPIVAETATLMYEPTSMEVKHVTSTEDLGKIKRTYFLIFLFSFALLAALWTWLFPTINQYHHELIRHAYTKCMLTGITTIVVFPLLSLFAIGTMIGMSLGMLLIILYIFIGTLGFVTMGFSVGAGLVKMCRCPALLEDRRLLPLISSLGIMGLLLLAYFVKFGFIASVTAFVSGLGAMVLLLQRAYHELPKTFTAAMPTDVNLAKA